MAYDPDRLEVIRGVKRGVATTTTGHIANMGDLTDRSTEQDDPLSGAGGFFGRFSPGSDIGDMLDSMIPIDPEGSE